MTFVAFVAHNPFFLVFFIAGGRNSLQNSVKNSLLLSDCTQLWRLFWLAFKSANFPVRLKNTVTFIKSDFRFAASVCVVERCPDAYRAPSVATWRNYNNNKLELSHRTRGPVISNKSPDLLCIYRSMPLVRYFSECLHTHGLLHVFSYTWYTISVYGHELNNRCYHKKSRHMWWMS